MKKSEEFILIVKENMEEYLKAIGYEDMSKADTTSIGMAFLRFYLYEIFILLNDIDEEAIETGIVDKSKDLGIDFLHIDGNQIFIIQAKYIGKNAKLVTSVLDEFSKLPERIKNNEFTEKAHPELKAILEEVMKISNPTYNLIFVTTDHIQQNKIDLYNSEIKQSNVFLHILDLGHLRQEYKRVESLNESPPNEVILDIGNEDFYNLKALLSNSEYPTFILTQRGTKIKDLFQKHSEALFNYNIRLWLGEKNVVNKSMIDTIKNEPERFFYYNNGITAVCEEIISPEDSKSNKIACKGFQIINGAQTVTTIAKQNVPSLSSLKIMMKIIVGETGKRTHLVTGLNENIVKNSNSQSTIAPSDFRSNDLIQVSIENQVKNKLSYTVITPIKPVFYQRKRRKEKAKSSKVITMQDLGKSYYSFKYNPIDLNASIKKLWDVSEVGVYYKVFGCDGEMSESITENKLYEMFGIHYIYEYIKIQLKSLKKEDTPSVLFKYHILWTIKVILNLKYTPDQINIIMKKIVKEGCFVNNKVNCEMEKKFNLLYERAFRCVTICIKNAQRTEKTFVIRNYQRKKDFIDAIDNQITGYIVPDTDIPDLL
jgi:hypothetical protein